MAAIRDRVRRALASPRAPWFILAATLVVTLPSIQLGFYNDDHALIAALRGTWPLGPPRWDLYRFATGDVATNRAVIEAGGLPWWTAPGLKLHLLRPVTSLLFGLDHAIFGDAPLGYHVHSIAWYLVLVAAVGLLFRSLASRPTANLAMLVFALSPAHFFPFGWVACRHVLLAAVPVVLGLVAFVRDRRRGPWWLAFAMAVGLAGSEAALAGAGYPLAYVLLGRDLPLRARGRAAGPTLAVVVAYLGVYAWLGGGAAESDGYVDPMSAPLRFALKAVVTLPVMIADAVFGVPAEVATIAPRLPLVVLGLCAAAFVTALVRACRSVMAEDEKAVLPWLVGGAFVALVPALGGFPGARALLVPNFGFALLLAVLIRRGLAGPGLVRRAAAGVLVLVHLVLAGVVDVGNASYNAGVARQLERVAAEADIGSSRPRVFVLGASDPTITIYVPAVLAATAPTRLVCWSVMSAAKRDHRLVRTGPSDLVLRPSAGALLEGPFETLYRAAERPLRVGERVRQCGAVYEVLAATDGKPTEVGIHFDQSLDDPSLRILVWKDGRLVPLALPAEGQTVDVVWASGPLGMF